MPDSSYDPMMMQRAVELSRLALESNKGLPIGCVIARNGEIVGEGHNLIFGRINPTAHAEMIAIEDACKNLSRLDLSGFDIYSSLEPCPMCLSAIYWAKLRCVYFANSHKVASEFGFSDEFIKADLAKPEHLRVVRCVGVDVPNAVAPLEDWQRTGRSSKQPWTKVDS